MIIETKDKLELVNTNSFPYAKFNFEQFNPPQSRILDAFDTDCNYIVSANMGSGKTECAEIFMSHEVRKNKNKAVYLAPLKSLAQEKVANWKSNHHFSDLNISICTGDYRFSQSRKEEITEADILLLTFEMLNSRIRNIKANPWLKQIGCLVLDEFHTIGAKERGDHIENALMKFTEVNPKAKLIALSGTLANAKELGEWLNKLNKKTTYVLLSDYRPVPLQIHYEQYWDVYGYDQNEREKIYHAIKLLEKHKDDKIILFVHGKKTGTLLTEEIKSNGIECYFHNADLPMNKRIEIENRFKDDPKLRCIVATSTLSQGINLPARRTIIVGIHRGLEKVDQDSINQSAGRAGRPKYDKQGDAHILLARSKFEQEKKYIQEKRPVLSQLRDTKTLAFHLISEIHHRNVQSLADIHDWYERSLAYHQDISLDENIVDQIIRRLIGCGAITEEENSYDVTSIGIISSMFYYSPFDISSLNRNFNKLFDYNKEINDHWIAMALANIDSNKSDIVSNSEKDEIAKFKKGLDQTNCEVIFCGDKGFTEGSLKAGCCYYNLLKGYKGLSLITPMNGFKMDAERLCEVLGSLDKMTSKWDKTEFFKRMYLRLLYGIEEEMVDLCRIKGIGKIKARRLWDANLRDLKLISGNILGVMKALNCSKNVATEICESAKECQ